MPQEPGENRAGQAGQAGEAGTVRADVLYRERQRVPMSWWLIGLGVTTLVGFQGQMGREWYWGVVVGAVVLAAVVWALLHLSSNELVVERDESGETWLHAGEASLPMSVVSRSLPVPPSARSAAMGRQLDPAAFLYHRPWIPSMAMLVLDDPDDPTPYWLVSTNEPEQLLDALGTPRA